MLGRIPFVKFFAVSAALCCAGGAAIVNLGGAGTAAAPSTGDHYLCVGDAGGWCIPARTTLPDGTTFGVTDPTDRVVCTPFRSNDQGRRARDSTTVEVTNEFSPTTLVPLAVGSTRSTCVIAPQLRSGHFSRSHAGTTVATFSCSDADYPRNAAIRFAPPFPVKIGDRLLLRVLDPTRLCVPTTAPTVAPAAVGYGAAWVCFDVSLANRSRRFTPDLNLCVPSTIGGTTPPGSSTTSSTSTTTRPATTTTTRPATTTTTRPATTTTTTQPATTTTTRPATTTTTRPATTTTTTQPATTTTTVPTSQPCPGIIVNGVCIITV